MKTWLFSWVILLIESSKQFSFHLKGPRLNWYLGPNEQNLGSTGHCFLSKKLWKSLTLRNDLFRKKGLILSFQITTFLWYRAYLIEWCPGLVARWHKMVKASATSLVVALTLMGFVTLASGAPQLTFTMRPMRPFIACRGCENFMQCFMMCPFKEYPGMNS